MPLKKLFSYHIPKVPPLLIFLALVLAVINHVTIFYFIHYVVSAFRLLNSSFQYSGFIFFTDTEKFGYSLFFAAIAGCLAMMLASEFLLSAINIRIPARRRLKFRQSLNDMSFMKSTYLFLLGKCLIVFGIIYLTFAIHYLIPFMQKFPVILALLPIVIFFQVTNSMKRVFRTGYKKFLFALAAYWILISVGLASLKFNELMAFESFLKSRSQLISNHIELPESKVFFSHYSYYVRTITMYISQSEEAPIPTVQFEGSQKKYPITQAIDSLKRNRNNADFWAKPLCRLVIDKNIKAHMIRKIDDQLGRAGFEKYLLAVKPAHSGLPDHYPEFRKTRIRFPVRYWPDMEAMLDSAEKLDPEKYRIRVPENSSIGYLKFSDQNRVKVTIRGGKYFVNNREMTLDEVEIFSYRFAHKYPEDHLILLDFDDNVTVGEFTALFGAISYQVQRLRLEEYTNRTGLPYSTDTELSRDDPARIKYRFGVIYLSDQERRIRALME